MSLTLFDGVVVENWYIGGYQLASKDRINSKFPHDCTLYYFY